MDILVFRSPLAAAIFFCLSIATYAADAPMEGKSVAPKVMPSSDEEVCSGSSGNEITLCAIAAEEKNAKVRQRRFQKIVSAYGSEDKSDANHLQALAERFADNRGRFESDATGTARTVIAIEARVGELERLLNDMESFEAGHFPDVHTADDLATKDQELNTVYKNIMDMQPDKDNRFGLTDITLGGIRMTERSWLAYRDAWTHFARLRYRHLDRISLQYLLTQRRLAELDDLLEIIRACVPCPYNSTTE